MTFDEWFSDMEQRYGACYESYKDLLQECWEAAQAQKKEEDTK